MLPRLGNETRLEGLCTHPLSAPEVRPEHACELQAYAVKYGCIPHSRTTRGTSRSSEKAACGGRENPFSTDDCSRAGKLAAYTVGVLECRELTF